MGRSARILKEMIEIWDVDDIDWMGYQISHKHELSYHHLKIPKKAGGAISIENGAILARRTGHSFLHTIEIYDRDRFLYLTKILIEVNEQRHMPTLQQLEAMDEALKVFEKEYSGYQTKKLTPLIKEEYTRRIGIEKYRYL